jgi:hypothetical protein
MLYSAIILGLLSSLHCIGMCGPIAMMLPLDRNNPAKKAAQLLLYHAGRLTAYCTLGLVFGLLGKGLHLAGMQQQLSIIAGLLMILIVLIPERIFARYNFSRPVYRLISNVKSLLGQQFGKKSSKALYLAGLFNGFLPCGLVYAALFGAIAMQNAGLGIAYMFLYGAGTIPMMSAVVYASGVLPNHLRGHMYKLVPYVTVLVGMLFIIRGLGLGIPFISPAESSLFVQSNPDCIVGHP